MLDKPQIVLQHLAQERQMANHSPFQLPGRAARGGRPMHWAVRSVATIGLLFSPVSTALARDVTEQDVAEEVIEEVIEVPDDPAEQDDSPKSSLPLIPDLEEFTPFKVRQNDTEIRPQIVVPAHDPWAATLAELEPDEQRQFKRLFGKLSAAEQAGFLEVSAWMRLGQRGLLVDLLLRSSRAEQAATFAFFAHLSAGRRRSMADLLDRHYGEYAQGIWETLPPYLVLASPREAEIVIFGPALKSVCGISPIEEENIGSAIEAEAAPYDPACHARVKVLAPRWVYSGRRFKGARFRLASTLTAPWQGALHRYGRSAASARDPLEIRNEWKRLRVERNDYERQHICGAVYIGGPWVLTAAHCVLPPPGKSHPPGGFLANRVIRLGSIFLSQGGQEIPITAVVHHNYQEGQSYRNDIALLRLAREPRVGPMASGGAQRANLPVRGAVRPGPSDDLIITGWGHSEISDVSGERSNLGRRAVQRITDALRYGTFRLWAATTCQNHPVVKAKRWTIHPGQICAGSRERQDACRGDSGGPMVWKRSNGAVLIGLVSYGKGCGVEGAPSIYTDVQYYVNNGWIDRAKSRAQPGVFAQQQ